jgi:hypothetical protein
VANNTDISDCFWFIEATTNGDTILLTNSKSASSFQAKVPFVLNNPDMVTYDEYDNESTALLSPPENLLSIVVCYFYRNFEEMKDS